MKSFFFLKRNGYIGEIGNNVLRFLRFVRHCQIKDKETTRKEVEIHGLGVINFVESKLA